MPPAPIDQPVGALFTELRRSGDPNARSALIERHLPLARRLAGRYRYAPQPLEDLFQVASLGLVKAVDAFDPAKGGSFLAFAVPTIIGELKHYMRDTAWAVHVPRALQERALTAERAERALAARSPAPPTVRELATEAGMSEEEVLEAFALRLTRDAIPLDTVTPADPSPPGARFSGAAPDPELENAEDRLSLWDALRALPQRERTILELRFVEDLTQTEIAERVGLSQIYVSRLLRAALETLRSNLD